METLKIRKVGNSLGAIFSKEMILKMHLKEGDVLYLTEDESGARVTPYDPVFAKGMTLYEKFNAKYRNVFRALATEDMNFAKNLIGKKIMGGVPKKKKNA